MARTVVRVTGPDAVSYLHGQLSQEIEGLEIGASAWSLLLTPKGRVDVWMRVTRVDEHEVLLDTDGDHGEALVARLERFKLRTDATIELLDWQAVAVRGPASGTAAPAEDDTISVGVAWPGLVGVDLLGPNTSVPAGATEVDAVAIERQRVAVAMPAMGAELTNDTIPAEMGTAFVESSASFTKGCYVGQELVARMASRGGSAPQRLVRLSGAGSCPDAGAAITVEGEAKGHVSTAVPNETAHTGWTGLGLLHRSVDAPLEVEVDAAAVQVAEATN
jgi:folate-binding protein YgfZ